MYDFIVLSIPFPLHSNSLNENTERHPYIDSCSYLNGLTYIWKVRVMELRADEVCMYTRQPKN